MISIGKRKQIKRLLRSGYTQQKAARAARVSVRSVRRIAREALPRQTDATTESRRRGVGRPSVTRQYRSSVLELLRNDRSVTTAAILRKLRRRGYAGSKSALYELVRELRATLERRHRPQDDG